VLGVAASLFAAAPVVESSRRLPVAATVDVVVAGGSVAAVAAAIEAAQAGRSVMLIAPRPHLGDELTDTYRLWLEEGERPTGALSERMFAGGNPAPPVRIKKTLEEALAKAGVRFLFSSYATEALQDRDGRPAGLVMTNRAGRQAIVAKVVIDATSDGVVARQAGASRRAAASGPLEVRRVALVDKAGRAEGYVRSFETNQDKTHYDEYTLRIDPGSGYRARMDAENRLRDATYVPGQQRGAGRMTFTPRDPVVGRGATGLDRFRPRGVDYVWVASAMADAPREEAAKLDRPTTAENIGKSIGAAAAVEAAKRAAPQGVRLRGPASTRKGAGDVREALDGLRPSEKAQSTVQADARPLPVLGEWDVVVIGGGTAGGAAAIAASRLGAKVLVAEYQYGLGGVGTLGLIGTPYHGYDAGFARELPWRRGSTTYEDKMEWYRREIRKNGGEVWFGVLGAGAYVEGNRVRGAVIATPEQRGVALAKVVVDATGNSDIAIAAGARYMYGADASDISLQGSGYPFWKATAGVTNTDYVMVDESDMIDVWRTLVGARMTMNDAAFDSGSLIQTRERRRIVGDFTVSYLDQISGRRYADSVVLGDAPYDTHGYPSHDVFALFPHDETTRKQEFSAPGGMAYTPYRALLPRAMDGVIVCGLGISIERDAAEIVRMQRDISNQGYAAGAAAAMAAKAGKGTRGFDVRALQKHLVEVGNLPSEVLEHVESFPRPDAEIEAAVRRLPLPAAREEVGRRLGLILSHRATALPMLRRAHQEATGEHRLVYARVLGMFGEREVTSELAAALDAIGEWDARILQGKMAEYSYQPTPIDTLILALGRTRDPRALPALLRKLETLDSTVWLSHHRALAVALESIADTRAAEPLARLLAKPGMSGFDAAEPVAINRKEAERQRIEPLRELTLARALYRCGDFRGKGEATLRRYHKDVRGVFARHAAAVLATQALPPAGSR
jgi:flavin-dependent dehydrogenase